MADRRNRQAQGPLHAEFLSGRGGTDTHPDSPAHLAYWNEQVSRCLNGFTYRGRHVVGSYYHYLNFFRMEVLTGRGADKRREYSWPYPCNTDEVVFEALEDCHRSWQTFMMFTSGGTGKTSIISSYLQREFTFFPRSYSIVTASTDIPATQMMKFIEDSLDALPAALRHELYPYSRHKTFASNSRRRDGTVDTGKSYNSVVEKIVFGDNSGAARSRRPTLLAMEEIGNWVGGAGLVDCYNATVARGRIQGEASCFYMMIGTGGHTRNNVISEIKSMVEHAAAYNLYLCDPWSTGKKSIFFIPAYKKRWGFYESTGIMDEVGARIACDAEREVKKADARAYLAIRREFPYTLEECFLREATGGIFYPDRLASQFQRISAMGRADGGDGGADGGADGNGDGGGGIAERGWWRWNLASGIPDWEPSAGGEVWRYRAPHRTYPPASDMRQNMSEHINGVVPRHLYTAGYDGIDMAKADSASGEGSMGCLLVKMRTTGPALDGNRYVCRINWRPDNHPDELYEQVLLCCIAYDCQVNIEHSRIGIKKYFEEKGHAWRLMRRPKSVTGNSLAGQSSGTALIGTLPTPANISYGIQLLQKYVFDYYTHIEDAEFLRQLAEFTYESKTDFDMVMAALWTEVGDEDLPAFTNRSEFTQGTEKFGWHTDRETGYRVYGVLPKNDHVTSADFLSANETARRNMLLMDPHLYQATA